MKAFFIGTKFLILIFCSCYFSPTSAQVIAKTNTSAKAYEWLSNRKLSQKESKLSRHRKLAIRMRRNWISAYYNHFAQGVMFQNVEKGLDVLWQASFKNGLVYKENLAYFTPEGLLILPNKDNTESSASHALETTLYREKQAARWKENYIQVLGIIHTHPDPDASQEHTPRLDFQMSFSGIHNYVMSKDALYDGYLKNGIEVVEPLGRRKDYRKLPKSFFESMKLASDVNDSLSSDSEN